jgi:hypothetical protein
MACSGTTLLYLHKVHIKIKAKFMLTLSLYEKIMFLHNTGMSRVKWIISLEASVYICDWLLSSERKGITTDLKFEVFEEVKMSIVIFCRYKVLQVLTSVCEGRIAVNSCETQVAACKTTRCYKH